MTINFLSTSFICFCISLFNTVTGIAQNTYQVENIKTVDIIVKAYVSQFEFSGNVLIGQGDSIIYKSTNGFANYEHEIHNTLETKFRLASLSKQFTAAALLILEQQGKVNFDEPISLYLSDLDSDIADKITIHQILSHSSGLARDIESLSDKDLGHSFIPLNKIIQLINESELQFNPGEKWSYSNLGYALAAAIIETTTGRSYGNALDKLLFEPLNMHNTKHETSSAIITNRASGYVSLPDGIVNASYEDKSYVIGAGSIYSTVNDLFIWSRELTNGSLISKENRNKLFSKQAGRYSYGWFIDTYVWPPVNDNNQAVNPHHEGGSPGFESKLSILTEHDLVVVILSNRIPSHLNRLANQITNVCVGFDEMPPEPDGTQEFFYTLFNQGVDSTVSMINSWKTSEKRHLVPSRNDVFLIGRGYIDTQDYEKATLIMDFLIKIRPKWSYPYLFKAIMLENQNKNEEAINLYKMILEINPEQSNAINRLKRLNEKE